MDYDFPKLNIKRYFSYNGEAIDFGDSVYGELCYKKDELESYLKNILEGKRLENIFFDGSMFLNDTGRLYENYIDCSDGPGLLILELDDIFMAFAIHAEGMFIKPAICSKEALNLREHLRSEGEYLEDVLVNVSDCNFGDEFKGHLIKNIEVEGTDMFSFRLEGFDADKAYIEGSKNNLPKDVKIYTENNCCINLCGDDIEYFNIKLEKNKN